MNSIIVNDISLCQSVGEESYVFFNRSPRPRKNGKDRYCQYKYITADGEVFHTLAPTLEQCREKKDQWLKERVASN